MGTLSVTASLPRLAAPSVDIRVVLAFFAIYVLWGATFLAIRVAVLEVPPFLVAGLRFFLAGSLLYSFMRMRGEASPSPAEWRSIGLMALFMFVATYGALFWAEQYVPSGITSVIEATLPITTLTFEVLVFRQQPFRWAMLGSVAVGFGGVLLLLVKNGERNFAVLPCLVILASGVAWSLGAVLMRSMPLPRSRALTSGGAMMLGGIVLLALSRLTGEANPLPYIPLRAGVALLYLIVGGSLIAFTAYVWLLARMPATRVASHAYVNPLVALALGYFVAGEELTVRTLLASILIVLSVFLILRVGDGTVKS
jgi:drug/metabolite transporter (DMT)-like permease